jgi:hypothetical protein
MAGRPQIGHHRFRHVRNRSFAAEGSPRSLSARECPGARRRHCYTPRWRISRDCHRGDLKKTEAVLAEVMITLRRLKAFTGSGKWYFCTSVVCDLTRMIPADRVMDEDTDYE